MSLLSTGFPCCDVVAVVIHVVVVVLVFLVVVVFIIIIIITMAVAREVRRPARPCFDLVQIDGG